MFLRLCAKMWRIILRSNLITVVITIYFLKKYLRAVWWNRLLTSMRDQIKGAKPMRNRIRVRLCRYKKLNFHMKNKFKVGYRYDFKETTKAQKLFWNARNLVYLLILINFFPPGAGSAFLIRIRIQESQMHAYPDSDSQHCLRECSRKLITSVSLPLSTWWDVYRNYQKRERSDNCILSVLF